METKEEIRPQTAKIIRSKTLADKEAIGLLPTLKKFPSMSYMPLRKSTTSEIHNKRIKLEIFIITWNMNGKVSLY